MKTWTDLIRAYNGVIVLEKLCLLTCSKKKKKIKNQVQKLLLPHPASLVPLLLKFTSERILNSTACLLIAIVTPTLGWNVIYLKLPYC